MRRRRTRTASREMGTSWADIGQALDIIKQAAHERFSATVDRWRSSLAEPWVADAAGYSPPVAGRGRGPQEVGPLTRRVGVHVRGTGAKDRVVPAPKGFRRLRVYIVRGRPKDAVSNRVFLFHRRRPTGGDYEPLTTYGVDQLIRNVAESAGITKHVYPHLLRHTFATWQLSRGMNPIHLAQILGTSRAFIRRRAPRPPPPATPHQAWSAVLGVLLNGSQRDAQALRDLAVAGASSHQPGNLELTVRQIRGSVLSAIPLHHLACEVEGRAH